MIQSLKNHLRKAAPRDRLHLIISLCNWARIASVVHGQFIHERCSLGTGAAQDNGVHRFSKRWRNESRKKTDSLSSNRKQWIYDSLLEEIMNPCTPYKQLGALILGPFFTAHLAFFKASWPPQECFFTRAHCSGSSKAWTIFRCQNGCFRWI